MLNKCPKVLIIILVLYRCSSSSSSHGWDILCKEREEVYLDPLFLYKLILCIIKILGTWDMYNRKTPSKTFTQTFDFLANIKTSHSVVCSCCEGDIVVGPLYFFEEDGVNVTNSSELWTTGQTVQFQRGFSLIKTVDWLFSHDDICNKLYVFK